METILQEPSSSQEESILTTASRLITALQKYGFQNPRIFQIPGSSPEITKHSLNLAKIPYTELQTKENILVEQSDYERCRQISAAASFKQRCFVQEYGEGDLEKVIEAHANILNKKMLLIRNLSQTEKDVFVNKCNDIKPGLLLETIPKEDGSYTVSIPQALLSSEEKEKVATAYIQSSFFVAGANTSIKSKGGELYTKENYSLILAEKDFIDKLISTVKEKLYSYGLTSEYIDDYLSSTQKQVAYILSNFAAGQEPNGFNQNNMDTLKTAYDALPNGIYSHTAVPFKRHSISSKTALDTQNISRGAVESPVQMQERED